MSPFSKIKKKNQIAPTLYSKYLDNFDEFHYVYSPYTTNTPSLGY